MTGGIDRFAPALGLPEISRTALKGFNKIYGNFANKPQYLFRGNPVSIYATGSALRSQTSVRGVPLRTGTYVIVPNEHLKYLVDEKLENYELRRGLIVPQGTTTLQARDRGLTTLPRITYATIDVTVKAAPASCGGGGQAQPAAEPTPAAPDGREHRQRPLRPPAAAAGGKAGAVNNVRSVRLEARPSFENKALLFGALR